MLLQRLCSARGCQVARYQPGSVLTGWLAHLIYDPQLAGRHQKDGKNCIIYYTRLAGRFCHPFYKLLHHRACIRFMYHPVQQSRLGVVRMDLSSKNNKKKFQKALRATASKHRQRSWIMEGIIFWVDPLFVFLGPVVWKTKPFINDGERQSYIFFFPIITESGQLSSGQSVAT